MAKLGVDATINMAVTALAITGSFFWVPCSASTAADVPPTKMFNEWYEGSSIYVIVFFSFTSRIPLAYLVVIDNLICVMPELVNSSDNFVNVLTFFLLMVFYCFSVLVGSL